MITETGYSKDPNIISEGIVITFGKEMMDKNGGTKEFLKYFIECVDDADDTNYWMHKMTNWPNKDFVDVYIIVLNRLWGRVKCIGFEKSESFAYSPIDEGLIKWPRMCLKGPFERCPFKRRLKGFQGFRYCTKLF